MNPEERIAAAEAAEARLQEAVRVARGTISDLHRVQKELQAISETAEDTLGKLLVDAAKLHIEEFGKKINEAIDVSQRKIYKRFDNIMAILMGEEKGEDESVDEMARRVRTAMTRMDKADDKVKKGVAYWRKNTL